ncbi:uncharacterized protein [Watersipora subatra]|uniref:uncharacterized protein n=1 Tax=Watersipora subatra TaxID=2589382 RepID=UPI00355B735A
MVLLRSCCCWWEHNDSLKRGSYASCIYSTIVAAFQLCLCGWAIYTTLWIRYAPDLNKRWQPNEIANWFPPGSDGFLYMAFIFVIAKLVVGILLWSGIQRGQYIKSKNYIKAWLITNLTFQLYIVVVVTYVCGFLQFYRLYDIYFMSRGLVIGVWFGVLDYGVVFWALICVFSFYQQLEEHEFRMFRKTKRALWGFDLGLTVRSGSIGTSRPPSTAYSFESLAVDNKPRPLPLDSYGVNSSSV